MLKKILLSPLFWTGLCFMVTFTIFVQYELLSGANCKYDMTTPYVMTLFVIGTLCVVTGLKVNAQLSRYAVILAAWIVCGVIYSLFDPLLAC